MAATAYITRFSRDARRWARLSNMEAVALLGGQDGGNLDLDLTDGEEHVAGPMDASCFCRIRIDGDNARMRIGKDAVADATGEKLFDGDDELRFVSKGEQIAIKIG